MSIQKRYVRELRDNTNYLPTWLPNVQVAPGDVGHITGLQYSGVGNLADYGIEIEIYEGDAEADYDYYSANHVSRTLKLAGHASPPGSTLTEAEAGISIHFSQENAVIFRATGCQSTRIRDLLGLERKIIAMYEAGDWPMDLVVVTEAVYADSVTILISAGQNAHIDLRATSNLAVPQLDLANAEAGLQVANEANVGVKIIASSGLTPLMRTSGLKKRFLRSDVAFRSSSQSHPDIAFADVEYEDYADD
jgi:hypothetical protein